MTPIRAACLALVFAVTAARWAHAGPRPEARPKPSAKAHIERATKAHQAGKFEEALTELQAAYAIEPKPDLLFAIGQVFTKLGRCTEATDAYRRFLATGSNPQAAPVIQQAIDSCKPRAAAPPEPPTPAAKPVFAPTQPRPPEPPRLTQEPPRPDAPPAPPPVAARPRPAAPPSPSPPPGRPPWYRDAVGDVLVAGGVVAAALGAITYRSARSDLDAAEGALTHTDYLDLVDGAHRKRIYAVALIGGGAALIGAGVVRFMMRSPRAETRRVAITPARGGGLVTWSRSF